MRRLNFFSFRIIIILPLNLANWMNVHMWKKNMPLRKKNGSAMKCYNQKNPWDKYWHCPFKRCQGEVWLTDLRIWVFWVFFSKTAFIVSWSHLAILESYQNLIPDLKSQDWIISYPNLFTSSFSPLPYPPSYAYRKMIKR